jgi:hypothetical protein
VITILAIQDAGATNEFTTLGSLGTTDAEDVGLLMRLNYGIAAVRVSKARIADGYYKHSFHIALPVERIREEVLGNTSRGACNRECQNFKPVYDVINGMTQVMEASVSQAIHRIYNLVPDRDRSRVASRAIYRRRGRGLFNFVGVVNHYLWGSATDRMVDELRESVKQAKELAETEAGRVRQIEQGLTRVSRLQNSRIDNLKSVLNADRQTLIQLYNEVKAVRAGSAADKDAITVVAQRITSYVSIHDDVQNLGNAIEELIHQQLSTNLIPMDQMEMVIQQANNDVSPLGAGLCQRLPQEVYASRVFDYARFGSDLVVRVYLPYYKVRYSNRGANPGFRIYKTKTFPMIVPGSQGLVSEIKDIPKFVIVSDVRDQVGTIEEVPMDGIIKNEDIKWYGSDSCVVAIVRNKPEIAHKNCKFVVRKETILPQSFKLKDHGTSGYHVLHNINDALVKCDKFNQNVTDQLPSRCSLCFLKLSCHCNMTSEGLTLRGDRTRCGVNESSSSEILHAVNLVLLQKFYDLSNVSVDAELLRVTAQTPEDITIPLFSENTKRILTQDQKQSHDLNQIVDAMENTTDHISYSSAEALLLDYIQSHPTGAFWDINWWTCTTWGIGVLFVGYVVFGVYYFQRSRADAEAIRRLTLVIAGANLVLPKVQGYGLRTTSMMTTTESTYDLDLDILKDQIFRHIDHIQTAAVLITAIIILGIIWYCWNSTQRKSFVYMDISSGTKQILVKLDKLPNSTQNFTLTTTTTKFWAQHFGLFGIISLDQPWKVRDVTTGKRSELKKWAWLNRTGSKIVRDILLEGNPIVLALFVHTHNLEYVTPAKKRVDDDILTV